MYSKDLGKKISSSFLLKQQKGELLGSMPPYGYLFTTEGGGKRLKVEPESAEIVKLIFDMREQGSSMIKIADHLNRNNIAAPRNHYYKLGVLSDCERNTKKALWQNGYIGGILKNEVYIGSQIQGKHDKKGKKTATIKPKSEWFIYENAHAAIIDKVQFNKVQRLLSEAGEKFKKLGNELGENIFVGKIFCSSCGKSLKRAYWRNDKTQEVRFRYACRDCAFVLRNSMNLKKVPQLPYEKLEEIVISALQRQLETCVNIDSLIEDVTNSAAITNKCFSLKSEYSKCQRNSKKAEDMLASAYTHHLAGLLDDKEFELARLNFEKEKKMAETKAERIQAELAGYELDKQRQNAFLANFRNFTGFVTLNRAMVSTLISRIEVSPLTNEISIVLNFMDELEKLNNLIEESGVLTDAC